MSRPIAALMTTVLSGSVLTSARARLSRGEREVHWWLRPRR